MQSEFTHQVLNDPHNPFAATPLWTILNDPDQSQFGANSEDGPLSCDAGTVFLLALVWCERGEVGLGGGGKRRGECSNEPRGKCIREAAVQR